MKAPYLVLALAVTACSGPGIRKPESERAPTLQAALGARTSVPSQEDAEQLGLTFNVRWEGRLIGEVEPGSAAAVAGLKQGDVLLAIDGITLFSQDDLDDYLSVSRPGQEVLVQVKPAGETEAREVQLTLGGKKAAAATDRQLHWQFASIAQLTRALELARAEKKKVMVGLSGAET